MRVIDNRVIPHSSDGFRTTRRFLVLLAVSVLLSACATQDPRTAEFSAQMNVLGQQLAAHQITQLDHSKRQLALIQRLFPEKPRLAEYASYMVMIDTKAQNGQMSPGERDYLQKKKWAEYEDARRASRPSVTYVPYQPYSQPSTGTIYNRLGNTIYGSDGTMCNTLGTSMYCQ